MIEKPDTLYWLFSTIAQTWGALLGVGGLLVVFKLDHLRDARWKIIEDLFPILLPSLFKSSRPRAIDILEVFRPVIGQSEGKFELKSGDYIEINGPNIKILKKIDQGFQGITGLHVANLGYRLADLKHIFDKEGDIRTKFFGFPRFARFRGFLGLSLATIVFSIWVLMFCEHLPEATWSWGTAVVVAGLLIIFSLRSMIKLCGVIIEGQK